MACCSVRPLRRCLKGPGSSTFARTFSSSPKRRRNGPLATFPPTSSAELDDTLSRWRNDVFLPNHLAANFRSLVHRPSLHHFLLNDDDPVLVDVPVANSPKPQQFRLFPLFVQNEPKTGGGTRRICDLMQTPADADALRPFLREFVASGRALRTGLKCHIARTAGRLGRVGLLADLVRHANATGLEVRTKREARVFIAEVVAEAIRSDWSAKALDRAAKNAKAILDSYEQACEKLPEAKYDARPAPDVYGAVLAVLASRAWMHRDGEDVDGEVEKMAKKMLRRWDARQLPSLDMDARWLANFLGVWAPTWQGMEMAARVLGQQSQLGKELRERETEVWVFIRSVLDKVKTSEEEAAKENATSGIALYDALTASLERPKGRTMDEAEQEES